MAETLSAVFSGAVLRNLLDRCCFKQWPRLHLCSGMHFTRLSGVLAGRELVHREEREEEKESGGGGKMDRETWKETAVKTRMSVIWGVIFKPKYEAVVKSQRGLDWYISVCSAHPLLQCNSPTRGQTQDNQLMIHLKLKLEHTSGGRGGLVRIINKKKKISVQDSYGPIIIPSAAVLVCAGGYAEYGCFATDTRQHFL